MSRDATSPDTAPTFFEAYSKYLFVGGAVLLFGLLALSLLGPTGAGKTETGKPEDDPLKTARSALTRETDLSTCRNALQQLNAYLSQDASRRAPSLTADQRAELQSLFGLEPGELAELESPTFTLLDGHYLEEAFLFRDAARSLDVQGATNAAGLAVEPTPLERVQTAFAWAMRQVRPVKGGPIVAPPLFVARRGFGSDLERALVFLDVLRQTGGSDERLTGCLVYLPERGSLTPRLWACGVLIGDSPDLYLFDPRLGLPLPGPGGKGVATLAQVRKDPTVLTQLDAGDLKYDVTPEQTERAELHLVYPLSGLAARMGYLQDKLLGTTIRVNLAASPLQDRKRLESAAKAVEGKVRVEAWKVRGADGRDHDGPGLLRRFLPETEGGSDKEHQLEQFQGALVPGNLIPRRLTDPQKFPGKSPPATARLLSFFAQPFIRSLAANEARDLLLRGRLDEATREKLIPENESLTNQETRGEVLGDEMRTKFEKWAEKAEAAYGELLRLKGPPAADSQSLQQAAQAAEAMWQPPEAEPLVVLLQTPTAKMRHAEVLYQLGLCQQERAEQTQERIDLIQRVVGAKAVSTEDWHEVRKHWLEAEGWWSRYPSGSAAGQARRLQGVALLRLADALTALADRQPPKDKQAEVWRQEAVKYRAAALAAWRDTKGLTDMEKIAAAYLVRQAK
jgi:hypothetical protein